MGKLLLLFIVVPAVELALLIELGSRIGTPWTLGVIALTGFVGAALARWQGLGVVRRMEAEMKSGGLPATSIVDGVLILVAAALLVTPGILTDGVGFLLLVPTTRQWIRRLVVQRVRRAAQEGTVRIYSDFRTGGQNEAQSHARGDDGPIINVESVETEER